MQLDLSLNIFHSIIIITRCEIRFYNFIWGLISFKAILVTIFNLISFQCRNILSKFFLHQKKVQIFNLIFFGKTKTWFIEQKLIKIFKEIMKHFNTLICISSPFWSSILKIFSETKSFQRRFYQCFYRLLLWSSFRWWN